MCCPHVIGPARDESRAGDRTDRKARQLMYCGLALTGREEPTTELE